ncbi:MAG TPA: hypothetical protein VEC38_13155 [Candidatus Binataceae bacterium]|nr:hypothetical protein [Candidatus Binataceae bacterium]
MKQHGIANAAAVLAAAFLLSVAAPRSAHALDLQHARAQRDLTPALRKSLTDQVSDEAGTYLDQEDQKRNSGKVFVDLQQKFEYLPNYGPRGQLVVSVKLGGVEYDPTKPGTSHGKPTGNLKYLVFSYSLEKGQWVEIEKPRWETESLGTKGAQQMTGNIARGEKAKAAAEQAAKTRAAAAAAAAAAQKAANASGNQ